MRRGHYADVLGQTWRLPQIAPWNESARRQAMRLLAWADHAFDIWVLPPAGEALGQKMAHVTDKVLVLEGRHHRPALARTDSIGVHSSGFGCRTMVYAPIGSESSSLSSRVMIRPSLLTLLVSIAGIA